MEGMRGRREEEEVKGREGGGEMKEGGEKVKKGEEHGGRREEKKGRIYCKRVKRVKKGREKSGEK